MDGVFGKIGELRECVNKEGKQIFGNYNQPLFTLTLTDPNDGEITTYWADGGLRGALTISKVLPGTMVNIVHTGETEMTLDDGKKGVVQTYEIYEAE